VTETETSTAPVETWAQQPATPSGPKQDRRADHASLVAARIARALAPSSVLDLGESRTLCDQLTDLGVNAEHTPVVVGPATGGASDTTPELKPGEWDLISCIGVLERLAPADAEALLEQMCQRATFVIASCGPATYFAPAETTVRPSAAWAASFAERGFFRRIDLDLEFAGPWTVVFERSALALRQVVYSYEQALATAQHDLGERVTARGPRRFGATGEKGASELEAEIAQLKHRLLVSHDYAIGQEAELARVQTEAEEVRKLLQDVYESNTWRYGSIIARPLSIVRRTLRPRA
jgi:hypothetical protein